MRLNFDEISIVTQVMADITHNPSKVNLIAYLAELENSDDTGDILRAVRNLREKMMSISQTQLNKMYEDLANGKISATRAYEIGEEQTEKR